MRYFLLLFWAQPKKLLLIPSAPVPSQSLHILGPTSGERESTLAGPACRRSLPGHTAATLRRKTFPKDRSPSRTVPSTLLQGLFPPQNAGRSLSRRSSPLQEGLELRDHPPRAQSVLRPNAESGLRKTPPHPGRTPN